MLAVEVPLTRATVSTRSGPPMVDTDECVRARHALRRLKQRVPEAQRRYGMRRWNALVNTTSPVERRAADRIVVNRAYHKMHEIALSCALPRTRRSAHLCEAPGGFVQCVADVLATPEWEWIAVTLDAEDAPRPSATLLPYDRGRFVYRDVRGDDVEGCARAVGRVDLVTADGAVAMDHDDLEAAHAPLLEAEARVALLCLEQGGTLVVKAFECLEPVTRIVVAWISSHFERTCVIKPHSSRPTNSERYLVFRGFLGDGGVARAIDCFTSQAWDADLQRVMASMARTQANALARVLPPPVDARQNDRVPPS